MKSRVSPGNRTSIPWTEEEDYFLKQVAQAPNLYRLWEQHASVQDWPPRSKKAIKSRINFLGQYKEIVDGSNGWISTRNLQKWLGLSPTNNGTIFRWMKMGLKTYKDKDSNTIKIHLIDFVEWALLKQPTEVSRAIKGNQLAIIWLLSQIGRWYGEVGYPKPPK